jgi:hypothetical protein
MLSPQPHLNYLHTIFGQVVRGLEVLPQIQQGDTMGVKILRLGPAAMAFRADEAAFTALVARANRYRGPASPGPDANFDDPDNLLPNKEWNRAQAFNFKLANFERFTGTRLVARVLATAPPGAQGGKLEHWLTRNALRLGTARRGALAVYFADRDEWVLKIGADSMATFILTAPDGKRPGASASLGGPEQQFLKSAGADAAAGIAAAAAKAPPEQPLTDGQKTKLKVDAVLDGLIFRLEPR